ncbi:uncharacterized protein LOC144425899 [Styela clava]
MSQASKITLSLFVTAFVVTVNCNTCSVKPMEKGVDLNKLAGTTWYQMLNADDPIDRVTPCYVMKFGEATENGISFEFVMLDPSNLGRVETSYQQFYKEGQAFRFKMDNEEKWLKASLKQALDKPKDASGDQKELLDHFKYPVYIYTDYETYFMGILCREDSPVAFAYSSYNGISAETTTKIYNAMIEHDDTPVPLYFSQCPLMENIEDYLK